MTGLIILSPTIEILSLFKKRQKEEFREGTVSHITIFEREVSLSLLFLHY